MKFSNINIIKNGSQSRVLFDTFNRSNDVNPKTGKFGVRCHHWLTAFFLRIIGKIADIKTTNGKTIHLNKNSFNKWRKRHRSEMALIQSSSLPSAEEIISHSKELIKKKEEAAQLEKQNQAATIIQKHARAFVAKSKFQKLKKATFTIQSHFRGHLARRELGNLKALKKEINAIKADIDKTKDEKEEKAKEHDEKISATREVKEALDSKKQALEKEIQGLQDKLAAKQALVDEQNQAGENAENSPEKSNSENALSKWCKKNITSKIKKKKDNPFKQVNVIQSEPTFITQLTLQQDIQLITSKITNKKEVLRAYKIQVGDFEHLRENIYPLEKKTELRKIQDAIDVKDEDLAKKEKEYDELILKMNSIGKAPSPSTLATPLKVEETEILLTKMKSTPVVVPNRSIQLTDPMEEVSTESAAKEEQTVTINHSENMFNDVETHAHKNLKTLMETMFEKFSNDIVKSWEFDPQTGKFKLTLDEPGKLWVRPVYDNGKKDPKTPKGVVLLMGNNNQREIKGQLEGNSNKITFSKGFETYCKYKKKIGFVTKEGVADGTIRSIQYSPNSQKITVVAYGKDRTWGIGSTETDVKKLNTVLETWNKGTIPIGNCEKFLSSQAS